MSSLDPLDFNLKTIPWPVTRILIKKVDPKEVVLCWCHGFVANTGIVCWRIYRLILAIHYAAHEE